MTIEEVIAAVPEWKGRPVSIEPIEGGLTNENYRLTVDGTRYCVRIPGRGADLLAVDRRNEYRNTLAAAASGVGAAVVHAVGDVPVMVLEWIEGDVQNSESVRDERSLPLVAAAIRRLHAGPPFVNDFHMFRIVERYRAIVAERGFTIPDDYDDHRAAVARIEAAMAVRGAELKPCNNDLLAANYIATPSGFRIIDYEYAGMNDPCFELGNTASECELTPDGLARLCELYFGRPLRNRVARARLWAIMSNYGWTLWAAIQTAISEIDFDFWEWGLGKYGRAVAALEGPELSGLLADVVRSD